MYLFLGLILLFNIRVSDFRLAVRDFAFGLNTDLGPPQWVLACCFCSRQKNNCSLIFLIRLYLANFYSIAAEV